MLEFESFYKRDSIQKRTASTSWPVQSPRWWRGVRSQRGRSHRRPWLDHRNNSDPKIFMRSSQNEYCHPEVHSLECSFLENVDWAFQPRQENFDVNRKVEASLQATSQDQERVPDSLVVYIPDAEGVFGRLRSERVQWNPHMSVWASRNQWIFLDSSSSVPVHQHGSKQLSVHLRPGSNAFDGDQR